MMRMTKLLLAAFVLGLGGCASISSNLSPGADLSDIRTIHIVKFPADGRGVDQVIADHLNLMGFQTTRGTASNMPAGVDALVTYQDRWMWDISMYMLELNVQVRDPKTEIALATATSYRPSLQRKSPARMASEVLNQIFVGK